MDSISPSRTKHTREGQIITRSKSNMGDEVNYMLMKQPRYPSKLYGYQAVVRNADTNTRYGPTWANATAAQKKARVENQYFGAGKYRRKRRYKGRGMYYGNSFAGQGNYFKRMMHRQMNRTFAGQTPLGGLFKKLGRRALGAVEGAVTGQGEYNLNDTAPASNNLVAGGGLSVPTFTTHDDETGALTVQHSEYVKDIYGLPWANTSNPSLGYKDGVSFQNDAISLNPGLSNTFPWLSQIASNYEEYEFHQLMFCFKTRVGDNLQTSDGQVGTLMMFTDYNATDKPRKTKQDMLQAYGTSVSKITDEDILHGIECDPSKIKGDAHKFVRVGATKQDLHDFDWGLFQISVDNTPIGLSNKVIGELYVSYTVTLRKPRLFAGLGLAIQQDQFYVKRLDRDSSNNYTDPIIGTGENNMIGGKLQRRTTTDSANTRGFQIVLPSSLSGRMEVLVIVDQKGSTQTGDTARVLFQDAQGNVSPARDLQCAGTTRGTISTLVVDDTDPGYIVGGEDATPGFGLAHFNVQMASRDVDNAVNFSITVQPSTMTDVLVLLRRYQSHELDASPNFLKADGSILEPDEDP